MIIAIIGSGGREHAICQKISESTRVEQIYCIPGNAGTSEIAKNVDIDLENFDQIKKFLKESNVDLVIIGPEKPLVEGIVDFLENENFKVFGPNKKSSQLEGSKIFTKKICEKYNIPTAKFGIFSEFEKVIQFLNSTTFPIVVKADGLASGKGVYICENKLHATNAVKEIFNGKFGKTKELLVEEFLNGDEMSFFIISDGKNFKKFQTAQDHKRILEGDKGKNTGGMGAYCPSGLINYELESKILNKIIKPTLKAINDLGENYKGFLYAGLMIIKNEPYLIEYNVRMGDPECQTILPLLKTDFLEIIESCCYNKLDNIKIEWENKKSLCIVLSSKGYPDTFNKNVKIYNLKNLKLTNNDFIFHAGTKKVNKEIFSIGGRVLNFVSISINYKNCRDRVLELINNLNWSNGYFRKDIGYKVIKK